MCTGMECLSSSDRRGARKRSEVSSPAAPRRKRWSAPERVPTAPRLDSGKIRATRGGISSCMGCMKNVTALRGCCLVDRENGETGREWRMEPFAMEI